MRDIIISASALLLAGLLAVSCDREAPAPGAPSAGPVRLEVRVTGGAGTRTTGVVSNSEDGEAKVNTLQVLVFDGDRLDGYGSSSASKVATVSCTSGSREVYALVNGPDASGYSGKSAFLAATASLAEEIDNFAMIGSTTATLQADGSVSVAVDRLAARVVIHAIQNAIENESLASSFHIESVYLTNVTGDVDLGGSSSYTVTDWYNRRGHEDDNNLGSFTDDNVGQDLAKGATYSTAHYFYSMPNANPGKVGLAEGETGFTPRAARLVVRVTIGGTLYDYPILLPSLQSNHSYEIQLLKITRVGNTDDGGHDPDDPDDIDEEKPVEGFEQDFEITVNDWTVVLVGNNGQVEI